MVSEHLDGTMDGWSWIGKQRVKSTQWILGILKSEYRHENTLLVHYNELTG